MWTPAKHWEGQDAFIIGGGNSLKDFDFSVLKNRNTIGCNDAFRLGADVCRVCLFGDASWFHKTRDALGPYEGAVFHVAPSLEKLNFEPKITALRRRGKGLHDEECIGWNFSTGACAVNFAINLGAKRIFLLGIDLALTGGKSHWHEHRAHPTKNEIFGRFCRGFKFIGDSLKLPKYQGIEVVHVTDQQSAMPWFVRMPFREFSIVMEQSPAKIPLWP
jgi:hypothetical protein